MTAFDLDAHPLKTKNVKATMEWIVLTAFLHYESHDFGKCFDVLTSCIEANPQEDLPKKCYIKFKTEIMGNYANWLRKNENPSHYYDCLEGLVYTTEIFTPPELVAIFRSVPKIKRVILRERQMIINLSLKIPLYREYFAAYGITLSRVLNKCA